MMQITIQKEQLLATLDAVKPASEPRSKIFFFQYVEIEAKKTLVSFTCINREYSLTSKVMAEIAKSGKLLVNAAKLHKLVKAMPKHTMITITEKYDNLCTLTTAKGSYILNTREIEDEYTIESCHEDKWKASFDIGSDTLKSIVTRTLPFIGQDEHRPHFTGINFLTENEKVVTCGTDGHRLIRIESEKVERITGEKVNFIARAAALKHFVAKAKGEMIVHTFEKGASFCAANLELKMHTIDENYPDVMRAVPTEKELTNECKMNKAELLDSLGRAVILANRTTEQIELRYDLDSMQVHTEDPETNQEMTETLESSFDGSPMRVGFNCGFLVDVLKRVPTEKVIFKHSKPINAALIFPEIQLPGEWQTLLLMPVRLLDND